MKNLFIILLLLPVAIAENTVQKPDWKAMPMAVPANEREGHAFRIAVDNIPTGAKDKQNKAVIQNIYQSIAVALVGDEVLYGHFNPDATEVGDKECATFHSPRGIQTICNGEFFLLHEDFARFKRIQVTNGNLPQNECEAMNGKVVEYLGYILILDRSDLTDVAEGSTVKYDPVKNAKFIGTWFKGNQEVSYHKHTGAGEKDVTIPSFNTDNDIRNRNQRFEILCRMDFPVEK